MRYEILVNTDLLSIEWIKNNKLHRLYGHAEESQSGTRWWYKDGRFHREDGPACEYRNGYKTWYINGYYIQI